MNRFFRVSLAAALIGLLLSATSPRAPLPRAQVADFGLFG
jgi:hypothetical protein